MTINFPYMLKLTRMIFNTASIGQVVMAWAAWAAEEFSDLAFCQTSCLDNSSFSDDSVPA